MNDLSIDIMYINKLNGRLVRFSKVRKDLWVCRCPICKDSKKNVFKRRFYIFLHNGKYSVKCHNCGFSLPFPKFLESEFPNEYREYLLEKLPKKTSLNKNRFKHIKDVIPKRIVCKGFDYTFLRRFDELSSDHPARIYTEKRKIPLDMVYYASNFSSMLQKLDLEKYMLSYKKSHEPRMIIPFYREDGISTVFQARAFSKNEYLRYITIKEDDSESKIYGLERVNKTKPVWCVEGPLDSLMIPNAIAMSGISTKLPRGINDFIFVYDNEPRKIDVVKNMRKRLNAGHKVVIFPERIKYDDLNDMVVQGNMNSDMILDILNNNIYEGSVGLMKLKQWSK